MEAVLSKPSFRDELARFVNEAGARQNLMACSSVDDDVGPIQKLPLQGLIGSARREFIARWAANEDVEFMWERLTQAIPELRAQDLISVVLKAYQDGKARVKRRKFDLRECRTWRAKCDADIKQVVRKNLPDVELADRLENIAGSLRLNDLLASFIPDEISRQDRRSGKRKTKQSGLKQRKWFLVKLGLYFYDLCGQWRDDEVAMLTRMAFGIKGKFDGDAVRELRRQRHKIAA